jgi:hypothetical protein
MLTDVFADAVPKHDIWPKMTMECGEISNCEIVVKIIVSAVGMCVSIHDVMSPD